MLSTSERPTMDSVNAINIINENQKTDTSNNNNTSSNPQKEVINNDSFNKLYELQKLIQKQAGLKDICNIYIFL